MAQSSGTCGSSATEYNTGDVPCYTTYGQNLGQAAFEIATVDYGFFVQDDWKSAQAHPEPGPPLRLPGIHRPYTDLQQPVGTYVPLPQSPTGPATKTTSAHASVSPRIYTVRARPFSAAVLACTMAASSTTSCDGVLPDRVAASQVAVSFRNSQGGPRFPGILPQNFSPTTLAAPRVQYFDKHFQNPQAMEYDLTLQQNLGGNTVFSLSYLAALGRELTNFVNTNLVNTQAVNNNSGTVTGRPM